MWSILDGLTAPMPLPPLASLSTGVSFWAVEPSSGHAVDPKEQGLRNAPCSPPHNPHTSALPYSESLSPILEGTAWDLVGKLTAPFSPGETTKHPASHPWIIVHPMDKGHIVPSASMTLGTWRTCEAET